MLPAWSGQRLAGLAAFVLVLVLSPPEENTSAGPQLSERASFSQ